jgi:hypothetical protein
MILTGTAVIAQCASIPILFETALSPAHNATEASMRKRLLAGVAVIALVAGVTGDAMALEHKAGRNVGRIHAGGTHGWNRHGSRFAEQGSRYQSGYKNLGPLGVTFGCGQPGTCQGFSVSAWSW